MGMTLISLINEVQDCLDLTRSSTVVGSIDQNTRQLVALANRLGRSLVREYPWRMLMSNIAKQTVAATTQTNFFPEFFDRMIDDSMWNATRLVPMQGPLIEEEWQTIKIQTVSSLYPVWRHRPGYWRDILILPVPATSEVINYSCMTNGWAINNSGAAKTGFTADDDTCVFDDDLMVAGITYRWRRAKRLEDWQSDMAEFDEVLRLRQAYDGARRTVDLSASPAYDVDPPIPVIPDQILV